MLERLRGRFSNDPRVDIEELDLQRAPRLDTGPCRSERHRACCGRRGWSRCCPAGASWWSRRGLRAGVPFAMSPFDRAIGHYRRYTSRTIRRTFEDAGRARAPSVRQRARSRCVDRRQRLLRLTPHDGIALRLWDRVVVPVTRRLEGRKRTSVRAVAARRWPHDQATEVVGALWLIVGLGSLLAAGVVALCLRLRSPIEFVLAAYTISWFCARHPLLLLSPARMVTRGWLLVGIAAGLVGAVVAWIRCGRPEPPPSVRNGESSRSGRFIPPSSCWRVGASRAGLQRWPRALHARQRR